MPSRPQSPCPKCGVLTASGYCEQHKKVIRRAMDSQRNPEHRKLYDYWWRTRSKAFLRDNPLCQCEECKTRPQGPRAATVVDHKIPHRGDITVFRDRSNWQAMAKVCHDRKTAREDGGFGNRSSKAG